MYLFNYINVFIYLYNYFPKLGYRYIYKGTHFHVSALLLLLCNECCSSTWVRLL